MDAKTFDRWTAAITRRPTRRAALRMLAGSLVAGLLANREVAPTRAFQRPDRDGDGLYDDDETDVYGTNPDVYDSDGDGVGDGEEVYLGTNPTIPDGVPPPAPGCPAGQTDCGGICVDLTTNNANCGACGAGCAEFVNCSSGQCGGVVAPPPAVVCAPGLHNCGTNCANVSQDAANCGIFGWDCGNRDLNFCYLGVCVNYCGVGTRRCTGEYHCRPYTEACPA